MLSTFGRTLNCFTTIQPITKYFDSVQTRVNVGISVKNSVSALVNHEIVDMWERRLNHSLRHILRNAYKLRLDKVYPSAVGLESTANVFVVSGIFMLISLTTFCAELFYIKLIRGSKRFMETGCKVSYKKEWERIRLLIMRPIKCLLTWLMYLRAYKMVYSSVP